MGSASSIAGGKVIEDDEFGDDFESGVSKKIPIECAAPARKTASVKSVGSFGIGKRKSRRSTRDKPVTKSLSLRSALSIDQEGEAEREKFRIELQNKTLQIAELEVRKEKLHSENQRLRGEIKALQATCMKLRNERAMALEGKEQALQRAAAFEKGELKLFVYDVITFDGDQCFRAYICMRLRAYFLALIRRIVPPSFYIEWWKVLICLQLNAHLHIVELLCVAE